MECESLMVDLSMKSNLFFLKDPYKLCPPKYLPLECRRVI